MAPYYNLKFNLLIKNIREWMGVWYSAKIFGWLRKSKYTIVYLSGAQDVAEIGKQVTGFQKTQHG